MYNETKRTVLQKAVTKPLLTQSVYTRSPRFVKKPTSFECTGLLRYFISQTKMNIHVLIPVHWVVYVKDVAGLSEKLVINFTAVCSPILWAVILETKASCRCVWWNVFAHVSGAIMLHSTLNKTSFTLGFLPLLSLFCFTLMHRRNSVPARKRNTPCDTKSLYCCRVKQFSYICYKRWCWS